VSIAPSAANCVDPEDLGVLCGVAAGPADPERIDFPAPRWAGARRMLARVVCGGIPR
jgi:hypothetical protein